MNRENGVFIAQIVGLIVIVLAMFGIDVDQETQTKLIAGLSAAGLILTSMIDRYRIYKNDTNKREGRGV